MAKKASQSALARLAPNLIEIKNPDGSVIQVPANSEENKILGMLLAAKMRACFEDHLKKYREADAVLSTKELKDLAEAFAKITEASGSIYEKGSDEILNQSKKAEPKVVAGTEEVRFDSLIDVKTNDNPAGKTGTPANNRG